MVQRRSGTDRSAAQVFPPDRRRSFPVLGALQACSAGPRLQPPDAFSTPCALGVGHRRPVPRRSGAKHQRSRFTTFVIDDRCVARSKHRKTKRTTAAFTFHDCLLSCDVMLKSTSFELLRRRDKLVTSSERYVLVICSLARWLLVFDLNQLATFRWRMVFDRIRRPQSRSQDDEPR